MSTDQHGSNRPHNRPSQGEPGQRPTDAAGNRTTRHRMQERQTREALNRGRGSDRKRIASQASKNGRPEYLFVEDVLTTRSEDLPAVEEGLGDLRDEALADLLGAASWTSVDNAPILGVATVTFDGPVDVDEVCRVFDVRIRLGAVMPMGVVHITPAGYCPDSEPIEFLNPPDQVPVPVDVSPDFGDGVSVVVIDTGRREDVEQTHTWLSSPPITGDLEQPGIEHYTGHGTFVCGVLRSMAPKVSIDVNGVLYALGAADEADMAQELYEAVFQDQPDIISMSAGTTSRDDLPPVTLSVICEQLAEQGVLLVAAAGNDGNTEAFYPAYFSVEDPRIGRPANPNVVSVGALTKDAKRADYSNHDWPVVYAQGSDVVNAYPNWTYTYQYPPMKGKPDAVFTNGLASWNGTSFSTPLVSGLIAAHMTLRGETDARTAWEHLLAHAVPVPSAGPSLQPGSQMVTP